MADMQDDSGLNIFNRLTRGEFSKAWNGVVDMAKMALNKSHR